jgi:hypothetical protein
MASILISFVGQQDPVSDKTKEDGSIVSLVQTLIAADNVIKHIFLLHTSDTADRAELTQGWLQEPPYHLAASSMTLMPVGVGLSADPVNLLLAVQAARQGVEQAQRALTADDTLEFNASSGTPVMKSAWSILQAAGYTPNSRVWQVRNPMEMQPGQVRVFQTNVDTLKKEFEIKVAKQQINDYNYSGALVTLAAAELTQSPIVELLEYARCRMAFDYDRAYACLHPVLDQVDARWHQEISTLRQRQYAALAREAYFNSLTRLKNRAYTEFLERLSSFQETALRGLVQNHLPGIDLRTGTDRAKEEIWEDLKQVEGGKLYRYLETYKIPPGNHALKLSGFVNVAVMRAILSYYPDYASIEPHLETLRKLIQDRNDFVHRLEGISSIEGEEMVLTAMRRILKQLRIPSVDHPFDDLNQQISNLLEKSLLTGDLGGGG